MKQKIRINKVIHTEARLKHKHHIIPKHMGGSDEPSNLIELTREEHAEAHLELYNLNGKKEDLGAYYLLSGQTDEAMKIRCILGGKIQGPKNSASGHMKNIQKIGCIIGGKKSSEICKEKQVNAFFDPILKKEIAKKGGKVQGKRNAESGHLKRIAQLPNKRNSGSKWITNGVVSKTIKFNEELPEGYEYGRFCPRKEKKIS